MNAIRRATERVDPVDPDDGDPAELEARENPGGGIPVYTLTPAGWRACRTAPTGWRVVIVSRPGHGEERRSPPFALSGPIGLGRAHQLWRDEWTAWPDGTAGAVFGVRWARVQGHDVAIAVYDGGDPETLVGLILADRIRR